MKLYYKIRDEIYPHVGESEIIHIGSTSIPSFPTKGDLDINVRTGAHSFSLVVRALIGIGYYRLAGTLQTDTLRHLKPSVNREIDVAIQVTVIGSEYDTFVLFNELLRFNINISSQYHKIKLLYGSISDDEYRNTKSEFIQKCLAATLSLSP